MKKLFFILSALLILNSCSFYKDVNILEIRDFKIVEFSEEVVEIDIELKVDNPNGYKVKLINSDINLKLNESNLGKLRLGKKIELPKKSTSIQTLTVLADYDKIQEALLENAFELFLSKTAFIQVTGSIKGKALGVAKKVKINYSEKLSLDDLDLDL